MLEKPKIAEGYYIVVRDPTLGHEWIPVRLGSGKVRYFATEEKANRWALQHVRFESEIRGG